MNEIEIQTDDRTVCEFDWCGDPAIESVTHPQRGAIDACSYHARHIREIPTDRFPAGEVLR